MTTETVNSLFVYGTLKRGQCREICWPRAPREVRRAWVWGELYDTGPYPALFPGADCVGGQLWIFEPWDLAPVLDVLDQVEEYRPGHEATNLYNRQIIQCEDDSAQSVPAYTYIYARMHERSTFERMPADYVWGDRRLAVWPAGAAW